MATESFGRTVHLNDDQFEQVVKAMECVNANPPKPCERKINWGDTQEIMQSLERKYSGGKQD